MNCDPQEANRFEAKQERGATELPVAMLDTQDECSLFRLSPELRNIIYGYAFSQKEPPEVHTASQRTAISLAIVRDYAPSNGFLRTCRSTHNEARGMFVKVQRDF